MCETAAVLLGHLSEKKVVQWMLNVQNKSSFYLVVPILKKIQACVCDIHRKDLEMMVVSWKLRPRSRKRSKPCFIIITL